MSAYLATAVINFCNDIYSRFSNVRQFQLYFHLILVWHGKPLSAHNHAG